MVEDTLSEGGFQSALTASGEEYRAIVTDINLVGKLDGWEVARAAREIDPAMPVLYMTGTQGEEWASRRAEQHLARKAVRPGPDRDCRCPAS
jgi:CheY-like chemotaxis protein